MTGAKTTLRRRRRPPPPSGRRDADLRDHGRIRPVYELEDGDKETRETFWSERDSTLDVVEQIGGQRR